MFVVGLVDPVTSRIPTNPRPWDEVFILDPRGLFSGPSFSAPAFSSTAGPLPSAWARGNRKKKVVNKINKIIKIFKIASPHIS